MTSYGSNNALNQALYGGISLLMNQYWRLWRKFLDGLKTQGVVRNVLHFNKQPTWT